MEENRENSMPDLLDLQEFDEEALKKESEEVLNMRLMTADNAVFTRTDGGFLSLRFEEKSYDRVGIYLTFPLTNPEEFISVQEADESEGNRDDPLAAGHAGGRAGYDQGAGTPALFHACDPKGHGSEG